MLRSRPRLGCGLYSSPLILGRISLASWESHMDFSVLSLGCLHSDVLTLSMS